MRKIPFALAFILLLGTIAGAQQGGANSKFAMDQPGPTLAEVQAYTFRYYADKATAGVIISGMVCTGTVSPFTCQFPIPAFTPGQHVIQFTASNAGGESAKSAAFTFTFIIQPGSPVNIRIVD